MSPLRLDLRRCRIRRVMASLMSLYLYLNMPTVSDFIQERLLYPDCSNNPSIIIDDLPNSRTCPSRGLQMSQGGAKVRELAVLDFRHKLLCSSSLRAVC